MAVDEGLTERGCLDESKAGRKTMQPCKRFSSGAGGRAGPRGDRGRRTMEGMKRLVFVGLAAAALAAAPAPPCCGGTFSMLESTVKIVKRWLPSRVEKELLEAGRKTVFAGKTVVRRDDLFNPRAMDGLGRTNVERMRQGLAPLGKDGKPMELHHHRQRSKGPILELTSTLHRKHGADLHRYSRESEIDRAEFERWKKGYWKRRAEDFR